MNFPHTILYHGNCIDGWFSAYFAYTSIGATNPVQMFPISPGQMNTWPNVKQMAGTHVLMLDVSVAEIHRTNWLENGVISVNCIDHHSSSIEHWAHDACPINVESCAAMQTFRHFYPEHPVPFWLEMIDRIDRWDNVTYEDRCIREILTIISHKPVQRKLDEAFMLLCRGMIERLEDDVPAQLHVEEIQGWYSNGNVAVAWAHAILVLEQVLGVPLRG